MNLANLNFPKQVRTGTELQSVLTKVFSQCETFSNILFILDKLHIDDHFGNVFECFQHIFDKEMTYAIQELRKINTNSKDREHLDIKNQIVNNTFIFKENLKTIVISLIDILWEAQVEPSKIKDRMAESEFSRWTQQYEEIQEIQEMDEELEGTQTSENMTSKAGSRIGDSQSCSNYRNEVDAIPSAYDNPCIPSQPDTQGLNVISFKRDTQLKAISQKNRLVSVYRHTDTLADTDKHFSMQNQNKSNTSAKSQEIDKISSKRNKNKKSDSSNSTRMKHDTSKNENYSTSKKICFDKISKSVRRPRAYSGKISNSSPRNNSSQAVKNSIRKKKQSLRRKLSEKKKKQLTNKKQSKSKSLITIY